MLVAYRKDTGAYLDRADSIVVTPGEAELLAHVVKRYALPEKDVVVLECDTAVQIPHLLRWDGAKLVDDQDKIDAIVAKASLADAVAERRDELVEKIEAKTATLKEVCEYLTKQPHG